MKKLLSIFLSFVMVFSMFSMLSIISKAEETTTYTKSYDFDTTLTEPVVAFNNGGVNGSSSNKAGVIDYTTVDSTYTDGNVLYFYTASAQWNNFGFSLNSDLYGRKVKSISFDMWSSEACAMEVKRTGLNDTVQNVSTYALSTLGVSSLPSATTKTRVTYNLNSTGAFQYNPTYLVFNTPSTKVYVYIDNVTVTFEKYSATFLGSAEGTFVNYADTEGVITLPSGELADDEFGGWVKDDDASVIYNAGDKVTLTGDSTFSAISANRLDREAPAAPTKASSSYNSITLTTVEGCEYSIDGLTWQSSPVFKGLLQSTTYTFYQRYAANAYYFVSPSSEAVKITTSNDIGKTTTYAATSVKTAHNGNYATQTSSAWPDAKYSNACTYAYIDVGNGAPTVGHYIEFTLTGLTPGYYSVYLTSRNTSSRSTCSVVASDGTNDSQALGSVNFADLTNLVGQYLGATTLAEQAVVTTGSTLKLRVEITKVLASNPSGFAIERFELTKTADYVDPLSVDASMSYGAAMRLNASTGMRFYTNVDQAKIAELKEQGATVEMGTLIAPVDLLGDAELTLDTPTENCLNVAFDADEYFTENSFSGIVGSIVDVKDKNANRQFVGRGYVSVTLNGKTVVSYASYNNGDIANNIRTIGYIATQVKADTVSYDKLADTHKTIVDKYAGLFA